MAWVAVGAVAIAFGLAWAGAVRRPFFDDDWLYLNVVQQPGWWHSGTVWSPAHGLYRPVLFLWFGLLHALFGLHPVAYHVVTAVVVLVVGLLTWRIAVSTGLRAGAVVAGAVVVLHSTFGVPISWSAASSSPLSVALALGAMLVLLSRPVSVLRAVSAGALLALGLLTREVVVMAPAVVVVIAWTRPGGTLVDALRRSLPLWIVDAGYLVLRAASGATNPPGPYHQQLSTQAVDNLFSLIFQTDGLGRTSLQLQTLEDLLLIAFLGATLVVSLARHNYLVLGGILWFLLGTVPVLFLVHHAQQPYYVDFALPGIALAIGAGIDQLAAVWSTTVAVAVGVVLVAVIAVVGHVASDFEFTHEFGADITETNRLVAQVEAAYPNRPSGADLIVVHSDRIAHDEQLVTRNGDLFRVEYGDPSLRVRFVH